MRADLAKSLGQAMYWGERATCARSPEDRLHCLEMQRLNFESACSEAIEAHPRLKDDVRECWTPQSLLGLLAGYDEGLL